MKRRTGTFVILLETQDRESPLIYSHKIQFQYPEFERYNSEAVALNPVTGDILIASKAKARAQKFSQPTRFFRLPRHLWEHETLAADPDPVAEFVGEVDLPRLFLPSESKRFAATAMDVSDDGERLVLLTYEHAFEFSLNRHLPRFRDSASMVRGEEYTLIPLLKLPQQEAIAYIPGSRAFIYNSERSRRQLRVERQLTPQD